MQGRTRFAPRAAIAALSVTVSALALAPASDAAPAESCLKAPQGAAPQGSHWYYRLERPSMRKCWYLAEKNRAVAQRTAAATVAPQPEPDEETDAAPAPAANVPATPAATTATPAANAAPPAPETPAPIITTLATRNVSNADVVAQSAAPDSAQPPVKATASPSPAADAASAPAPQASGEQQTPAAVAEQPVAPSAAAAEADQATIAPANTLSTLQLLLGAIALLGLLSSAVFFVMAMVRRRNDVLSRWRETDALPFEQSPEMAAEEDAAFQPLRALAQIRQRDLDPIRQHDDVDEALRRMMRRRRAA
jgi:hypothetical protein